MASSGDLEMMRIYISWKLILSEELTCDLHWLDVTKNQELYELTLVSWIIALLLSDIYFYSIEND